MIFMMQFTERNFNLEKMRPPKGKWSSEKWNPKGNLSYFSKKRNMSEVLEKDTNPTFLKTFERRLLGHEKKLEENFGSEETWEAKKRPGAIFDHREPSRTEKSGMRDKKRRRIPKLRRVQMLPDGVSTRG